MATRWTLHVNNWKECTRCELHKTRQNIVLATGDLPCDIAFIGEAPGHSEDSIGEPFCGPAGDKLREDIIAQSIGDTFSMLFSNLISCIPLGEDLQKTMEPPLESIKRCQPRLIDLLDFANPQLIVCVGKLAEKYLNQQLKIAAKLVRRVPMVTILHPSFILRQQIVMQPLLLKQQRITLKDACDTIIPRKPKL